MMRVTIIGELLLHLWVKQIAFVKSICKFCMCKGVVFKKIRDKEYEYSCNDEGINYVFNIIIDKESLKLTIFSNGDVIFKATIIYNIHEETRDFVRYLRKQEESVGNV